LSAGVGVGLQCVSAGASFGAGFVGSTGGIAAITSLAPGGFLWGAAIAGGAAGVGGFVTGAGNAWMQGKSFGKGLELGLKRGVENGLMAGITGGLLSGLNAALDGRNFFDGSRKLMDYSWDVQMNFTPVDGYCGGEFTETADIYYGKESRDYKSIGRTVSEYENIEQFVEGYPNETGYSIEKIGSRSIDREIMAENLKLASETKTAVATVHNLEGQSHMSALSRFVYKSNGKIILWDNNGARHALTRFPYFEKGNWGNAWTFYLFKVR